jgi:hypothetical protein
MGNRGTDKPKIEFLKLRSEKAGIRELTWFVGDDCPPQKLNDPHAARAKRLYSS